MLGESILAEGVVFLCVGMGVVYIFLSLMVWMMGLSAKVSAWLCKFFPEEVAAPKVRKTNGEEEAAIAAAIAIAKTQG